LGNTELGTFTIGKMKAGIALLSKGREEEEYREKKTNM
jgi:hypothetical protein